MVGGDIGNRSSASSRGRLLRLRKRPSQLFENGKNGQHAPVSLNGSAKRRLGCCQQQVWVVRLLEKHGPGRALLNRRLNSTRKDYDPRRRPQLRCCGGKCKSILAVAEADVCHDQPDPCISLQRRDGFFIGSCAYHGVTPLPEQLGGGSHNQGIVINDKYTVHAIPFCNARRRCVVVPRLVRSRHSRQVSCDGWIAMLAELLQGRQIANAG